MPNSKDDKDELDFTSNPYFGDINSDILDIHEEAIEDVQEEYVQGQIAEKVEKLAEDTVRELANESLPPLPANYQMYFERLLEKEDVILKQKIQAVIDLQTISEDRIIAFERSVKDSFKNIKKILELVAALYKNIQVTQGISDKYSKELAKIDNKLVFNNTVQIFLKDLNQMKVQADEQLLQIKSIYQSTAQMINNVNNNTIYDPKFGVYNKRYFISLIEKERELIGELKHETTILTLSLARSITADLKDRAMILVLLKSIAKLLLKTSRRSDILAYIGDGIFAMGLKNSDLPSAKKATERLIETAKTTNVFSDGKDIVLKIAIGISRVVPSKSAENILESSLSALSSALEENVDFKVYAQDEV